MHTRAPPGPPWDPRFDPRKRRYADHIRPQSAVWLHLRTVAIATSSDTTLHVDGEVLHPDELVINACMLVIDIERLRQQSRTELHRSVARGACNATLRTRRCTMLSLRGTSHQT